MVNNTLNQFGFVIKEKRLAAGISANELANTINISRATLSAIENGNANASIKTYLDLAGALGISISFDSNKTLTTTNRKRTPKRLTKETIKKNQFEVFCIEKYAGHIGNSGGQIYSLFKKEGLLDMLRDDYEDLHGMGTEYLMQLFDSYLENNKI